MRIKRFNTWLGLAIVIAMAVSLVAIAGNTTSVAADEPPEDCPDCCLSAGYPILHPDTPTIERWIASYEAAPKYEAKGGEMFASTTPTSSYSVLSHVDYITNDRDQGSCGNCWVWAGTGCMEIAHDVENGVFDRLSIQYLNSNYGGGDGSDYACCGGWLSDLASFYDSAFAIPWSNTNAGWQDGNTCCHSPTQCPGPNDDTNVAAGTITTTPRYDILNAQEYTITTHGVSDDTAIANIKSVLDSNQGVWFAFFLPNFNDFFHFWDWDGPAAVWDFDPYAGQDYDNGVNPGGHAVLCVGYNDDVGTTNDYWIMLNSWGDAGGTRTDGLFRLDMHMNYSATLTDLSTPYGGYIHYWQKLDIDFNAPQVEAGPDQTADEGDTVSFSGSYTWPGTPPASPNINWDFGDGSTASGSLTPTHVYCDNGVYTVTLVVSDNSGHWGQDTLTVTVNNVAPTVDAGGDQTVDEGDTVSFSGSFTDPGTCDTHTIEWDFGDGSTASGSLNPTHVYCDNGSYTVVLTVTDDDGGSDTDTVTVTINNVAPTADAGGDQTVDEGDTVTFSGSFTDPGTCDTHTIEWDFGDGSTASGSLNPAHIYGDNGIFTVTLTVTDDDGGVGVDDLTVTVNNVAPTILAQSMEQPNDEFILPVVHTLDFDARATDPGSDDLTFVWDWGDGTHDTHVYYNDGIGPDPYPSPEVKPMDVTDTVSHVYMSPGDYVVALTITDDDGGTNTATQPVHVCGVSEALHITNGYIQSLPGTAFRGKANLQKAAINNMFKAIDQMLAQKEYKGMIQDLRSNIREKADGYVDGKLNNDWIIDPVAQNKICQKIDDITAYLATLL